jgi:cytochrome c biogenesis protein CcmG, thiol:disulfide interchange protein DsbE
MRFRQILIAAAVVLLAGLVVVVVASNGGDDGAGNPESELSAEEASRPLDKAPPELAALRDEANELLPGGVDALEERLAELEGHPVVINKWASWCGPCRFEFPFFQQQAAQRGDQVAFLGIDSDDSDDAARMFLEELPLPYPSYTDPDTEIAESLDAHREFPATVFIDSSGQQVYVKRGGYASEDDLIADIERYAN